MLNANCNMQQAVVPYPVATLCTGCLGVATVTMPFKLTLSAKKKNYQFIVDHIG